MTDIIIDTETFDLAIINGDFEIKNSEKQHIQLLLITNRGNWKEFLYVGAGLLDALLSEQSLSENNLPTELQQEIRSQIELDGGTIQQIENNIITAYYR